MVKLTQQQEKFAQLVTRGMNQTNACKEAYNTGKMKPNTIWVKASQLANAGKDFRNSRGYFRQCKVITNPILYGKGRVSG